ncbi:hypothetical protein ACA910_007696 [Epithemia clementina (nom. ined.)]
MVKKRDICLYVFECETCGKNYATEKGALECEVVCGKTKKATATTTTTATKNTPNLHQHDDDDTDDLPVFSLDLIRPLIRPAPTDSLARDFSAAATEQPSAPIYQQGTGTLPKTPSLQQQQQEAEEKKEEIGLMDEDMDGQPLESKCPLHEGMHDEASLGSEAVLDEEVDGKPLERETKSHVRVVSTEPEEQQQDENNSEQTEEQQEQGEDTIVERGHNDQESKSKTIFSRSSESDRREYITFVDNFISQHQLTLKNWDEFFVLLKEFHQKFGHTRVPVNNFQDNDSEQFKKFAYWVRNQRQFLLKRRKEEGDQMKHVFAQRFAKLDSLGIRWPASSSSNSVEKAHRYDEEKENKRNTPPENRSERQEHAIFVDAYVSQQQQAPTRWNDFYSLLKAFHETFGHTRVIYSNTQPHKSEQLKKLANWVHNQRYFLSKRHKEEGESMKQLFVERIAKLDKLGFDWPPSSTLISHSSELRRHSPINSKALVVAAPSLVHPSSHCTSPAADSKPPSLEDTGTNPVQNNPAENLTHAVGDHVNGMTTTYSPGARDQEQSSDNGPRPDSIVSIEDSRSRSQHCGNQAKDHQEDLPDSTTVSPRANTDTPVPLETFSSTMDHNTAMSPDGKGIDVAVAEDENHQANTSVTRRREQFDDSNEDSRSQISDTREDFDQSENASEEGSAAVLRTARIESNGGLLPAVQRQQQDSPLARACHGVADQFKEGKVRPSQGDRSGKQFLPNDENGKILSCKSVGHTPQCEKVHSERYALDQCGSTVSAWASHAYPTEEQQSVASCDGAAVQASLSCPSAATAERSAEHDDSVITIVAPDPSPTGPSTNSSHASTLRHHSKIKLEEAEDLFMSRVDLHISNSEASTKTKVPTVWCSALLGSHKLEEVKEPRRRKAFSVELTTSPVLEYSVAPHFTKLVPRHLNGQTFLDHQDVACMKDADPLLSTCRAKLTPVQGDPNSWILDVYFGPQMTDMNGCMKKIKAWLGGVWARCMMSILEESGQDFTLGIDASKAVIAKPYAWNGKVLLLPRLGNEEPTTSCLDDKLQEALQQGGVLVSEVNGQEASKFLSFFKKRSISRKSSGKLALSGKIFKTRGNTHKTSRPTFATTADPIATSTNGGTESPTGPDKSHGNLLDGQTAGQLAYNNFLVKYRPLALIEFKDADINIISTISSMWKQHKAKYGVLCDDNCVCVYDLGFLTEHVVRDKLADSNWRNPLRLQASDVPVGFAQYFCQKFLPLLRDQYQSDSPRNALRRLIEMWKKHQSTRVYGMKCSESCECLQGWDVVFNQGLMAAGYSQKLLPLLKSKRKEKEPKSSVGLPGVDHAEIAWSDRKPSASRAVPSSSYANANAIPDSKRNKSDAIDNASGSIKSVSNHSADADASSTDEKSTPNLGEVRVASNMSCTSSAYQMTLKKKSKSDPVSLAANHQRQSFVGSAAHPRQNAVEQRMPPKLLSATGTSGGVSGPVKVASIRLPDIVSPLHKPIPKKTQCQVPELSSSAKRQAAGKSLTTIASETTNREKRPWCPPPNDISKDDVEAFSVAGSEPLPAKFSGKRSKTSSIHETVGGASRLPSSIAGHPSSAVADTWKKYVKRAGGHGQSPPRKKVKCFKEYSVSFWCAEPMGFYFATSLTNEGIKVCRVMSVCPKFIGKRDERIRQGTTVVAVKTKKGRMEIRTSKQLKTTYEQARANNQTIELFLKNDEACEDTFEDSLSRKVRYNEDWTSAGKWRGRPNGEGWPGGALFAAPRTQSQCKAQPQKALTGSNRATAAELSGNEWVPVRLKRHRMDKDPISILSNRHVRASPKKKATIHEDRNEEIHFALESSQNEFSVMSTQVESLSNTFDLKIVKDHEVVSQTAAITSLPALHSPMDADPCPDVSLAHKKAMLEKIAIAVKSKTFLDVLELFETGQAGEVTKEELWNLRQGIAGQRHLRDFKMKDKILKIYITALDIAKNAQVLAEWKDFEVTVLGVDCNVCNNGVKIPEEDLQLELKMERNECTGSVCEIKVEHIRYISVAGIAENQPSLALRYNQAIDPHRMLSIELQQKDSSGRRMVLGSLDILFWQIIHQLKLWESTSATRMYTFLRNCLEIQATITLKYHHMHLDISKMMAKRRDFCVKLNELLLWIDNFNEKLKPEEKDCCSFSVEVPIMKSTLLCSAVMLVEEPLVKNLLDRGALVTAAVLEEATGTRAEGYSQETRQKIVQLLHEHFK